MKILSYLFLVVALLLAVCVTGCGKKANQQATTPTISETMKSGTCVVCNKQSDRLLPLTSKDKAYTAMVCSPDCANKFLSNPAQYGKKK